jgi:hypothetical protein
MTMANGTVSHTAGRGLGNAGPLGDLLEAEAEEVMLDHGIPARPRHLAERPANIGAFRKRRRLAAYRQHHLRDIVGHPGPPGRRSAIHQRDVPGNGDRPRNQRVPGVERVPGTVDLQKRLLDQIVGLGGITRLPEQIAAQDRRERGMDLVEGLEAPGLVVRHQVA